MFRVLCSPLCQDSSIDSSSSSSSSSSSNSGGNGEDRSSGGNKDHAASLPLRIISDAKDAKGTAPLVLVCVCLCVYVCV